MYQNYFMIIEVFLEIFIVSFKTKHTEKMYVNSDEK